MKVKVRTFATIRDIVGKPEIECEVNQDFTLGNLLDDLCRKYGKTFEHQIKDRATGAIVRLVKRRAVTSKWLKEG